tara:strand:+ start:214 stop:1485 length:1272 start_codon:yes stop_codon:yes gene_type:complete
MSTNEQQNAGLDLLLQAHGLDPIGHFFISESLRHIQEEEKLHNVEFVVFYGGGGSESHFKMWNPVFEQQKERFISIFRSKDAWRPVRDNENVIPIAALPQIEIFFDRLPNLKAVFYPANNGTNCEVIRQNHLQHIFIGHGDSNKSASANKVFRLYDEVWVAGKAHIDRFSSVNIDVSGFEFKIIGQPWMKSALEKHQSNENESMYWCYLPTWKGNTPSQHYSSLGYFEEFYETAFRKLPVNFTGLIKPHPWTEHEVLSSVDDYLHKNDQSVIEKGADRISLEAAPAPMSMLEADISISEALANGPKFVVCDISAAVTECLLWDVPMFLFNPSLPSLPERELNELYPGCYIFSNADELSRLLEDVILNGNDTKFLTRRQMVAYTVDIEKTKNNAVFQELDRISSSYPSQFNHDLTEPQSLAARM